MQLILKLTLEINIPVVVLVQFTEIYNFNKVINIHTGPLTFDRL